MQNGTFVNLIGDEPAILTNLIRDAEAYIAIRQIERRSDNEYDLTIRGTIERNSYSSPVMFSSWLPLLWLQERTYWTSPLIAELSIHSEMAVQGDWSGIRDNSEADIIAMVERSRSEEYCCDLIRPTAAEIEQDSAIRFAQEASAYLHGRGR